MRLRSFAVLLLLLASVSEAQVRMAPEREMSLEQALEIAPGISESLSAVLADSVSFAPAFSLYPDGTTPEAYWARIRLLSVADEPVEWVVPLSLDDVLAVLVRSDGTREVYRTGRRLPLAERTVPLADPPIVRFRLSAGEAATLYLRVRHRGNAYDLPLEPRPVDYDTFMGQQRSSDIALAMFLGVLFALAFYNCFLFFTFRDRSYLYYVLFLIGAMIYWAVRKGFVIQFLWPPDRLGYLEFNFAGLVIAAVSYVLFARAFLHTRERLPRTDRLLVSLAVAWGLCGLLGMLGAWTIAVKLAALTALTMQVAAYVAGVLAYRSGFRPAAHYLVASSVFFVFGLVYTVLFLLNSTLMRDVAMLVQIGMLFEVLLFAVALSARIRISEAAREEAVLARDRAEAMKTILVEEGELKTHLLGVAAHDLRSPLTGIMGFAEQLDAETPKRPDLRELTSAIRRGAYRMLSLIEDLLVTSAIDGGHLALNPSRIDLSELAASVAEDYLVRAEAKRQTVRVCEDAEALFVLVDPERGRAILENLISNAVKYTPLGGDIEIRSASGGGMARVSVSDTGPGLTAEDQQALFQRFHRLTPQPTGNESSSGLGLAIAQQLAHLHNGWIDVESTLGVGSVFTFVVPLAPEAYGIGGDGAATREAQIA